MNDNFRFILVGTGNIAKTYVAAVKKVEGISVAGFVSRSGRRPEGASEADGPVFAALADVNIPYDAVILATPNGCHAETCLEAARLGKHVFTEKTLAPVPEDACKMIRACKENGVCLGVAFQRRTAPDNITVKRLVQQGKLGKIYSAELRVPFYRPQSYYDLSPYRGTLEIDGGGVFAQQASHDLDLYVWFFGLPDEIHAFTGTFNHKIEGEDYGSAIFRHKNGMIGTVIASTLSKPGFAAHLEIHSEKGTVALEGDHIVFWDIDGLENPASSDGAELHSGASTHAVSVTTGHENLLRDFALCCRSGKQPLVSGEDALGTTELIAEIYAAAKNELLFSGNGSCG